MSSIHAAERERALKRLGVLREAASQAAQSRSSFVVLLEDASDELERLLVSDDNDEGELRRDIGRARMILETWRSTAGAAATRSR